MSKASQLLSQDEDDGLDWYTYEDWQTYGCHVIKGQQSTRRDFLSGKPLFSEEQVEDNDNWDEDLHDNWGDR